VSGASIRLATPDDAEAISSVRLAAWRAARGLGCALMAATLPRLRRPVALWVLCDNARARRFYEIAGFRADGSVQDADLYGATLPEVRYRLG
jgi:GNAT superfamily N-acetyltransferase